VTRTPLPLTFIDPVRRSKLAAALNCRFCSPFNVFVVPVAVTT